MLMKRIVILIATALLAITYMDAQVVPGMKYRDIKDLYDPKDYVRSYTDAYSPGWCAVGSLVIPGLGQVCCGESGRGIAFFLTSSLFSSISFVYGASLKDLAIIEDGKVTGFSDTERAKKLTWYLLGSGAMALAVDIWSIVDAVKVAKVKNMYSQDLFNRRTNEFKMYPSVGFIPSAGGMQPTTGVTVAMSF